MRTPDNPAELASVAPTEPPPATAPTAGAPRKSLSEAMRRAHERKRALGLPWKGNRKDKGKGKNKGAKHKKPPRKVVAGKRKGGPGQSREEIEAFRAKLRPYIDSHTGRQLAAKFGRSESTVGYHLAALRREAAEGKDTSQAVVVAGHGGTRGRHVVIGEPEPRGGAVNPLQQALILFRDVNRRSYQSAWNERRELTLDELDIAKGVKLALGDDPVLNP